MDVHYSSCMDSGPFNVCNLLKPDYQGPEVINKQTAELEQFFDHIRSLVFGHSWISECMNLERKKSEVFKTSFLKIGPVAMKL